MQVGRMFSTARLQELLRTELSSVGLSTQPWRSQRWGPAGGGPSSAPAVRPSAQGLWAGSDEGGGEAQMCAGTLEAVLGPVRESGREGSTVHPCCCTLGCLPQGPGRSGPAGASLSSLLPVPTPPPPPLLIAAPLWNFLPPLVSQNFCVTGQKCV